MKFSPDKYHGYITMLNLHIKENLQKQRKRNVHVRLQWWLCDKTIDGKKNKNVIFQWTILSTFNRCQVVLYIPCFAVDLRHCHFTAVICKAELGVQVWSVHKRKTLQTLDYIYRLLFNWLEWGVQNWRSPLWHCHLTIQSNTVSSFCVQANMCKRQRASRVTEGPFKSETLKSNGHIMVSRVLCSHETREEYYTVIESTQTDDLVSHGWNIRQESIDLLQVNLGCLSWAVLQSFMLVQAPIGKHEHQGHVLSRAAFVATDGLPDNIYMTNTMKWKGAKETKSENIVAVRVPIMHCHGRLPRSHRLTLDMLSAAKQQ